VIVDILLGEAETRLERGGEVEAGWNAALEERVSSLRPEEFRG